MHGEKQRQMKNLENSIDKFYAKVFKLESKDPFQLLKLKEKISRYKAEAEFCEKNIEEIYGLSHWTMLSDLNESANAVHEFIFDTYKFNTEWDEDMANYLLKATDIEASNYLMDEFFPRFQQFIESYVEWYQDGNVVKMGEDNYIEQTTQWKKKFTEEELMKFYVKEYCSDQFNINN